jgi:hypothetical protein
VLSDVSSNAQALRVVTRPDINKYVPSHLRKYLHGGSIAYTDILRYLSLGTATAIPPYRVTVETIPPLFAQKVKIVSASIIFTSLQSRD